MKGDFTSSVSQNCFSFFKNDMEKRMFEISVQKLLSSGRSVLGRVLLKTQTWGFKLKSSSFLLFHWWSGRIILESLI